MFEKIFVTATRCGARILFLVALVMVAVGLAHVVVVIGNFGMTGPSLVEQMGWLGTIVTISYSALLPAANLFAAALVVNHLDKWAADRAARGARDAE